MMIVFFLNYLKLFKFRISNFNTSLSNLNLNCWDMSYNKQMELNNQQMAQKCNISNFPMSEELEIKNDTRLSNESDFKNLVNTQIQFVDKSLFIKSLQFHSCLVITRPRRWGKSFFCSMVKNFYKMEVDENGNRLQIQPYLHYFRGGQINNKYFPPLNIWVQHKQFCQQKQAQYPLIHLILTKDKASSQINYHNLKNSFISILYDHLISNFPYLQQKNQFKKYCQLLQKMKFFYDNDSSQIDAKQVKIFNLSKCLATVCQTICKFHKKKCIIIIDQFDSYVVEMVNQKKDIKQCLDLAEQFTIMLQNVSKHSDNTHFILLAGIFNILVKGVLNNISLNRIYDHKTYCEFGFTQKEIQKYLISKILSQPKQLLLKKINQWYNGYNLYDGTNKIKIYNPWSVSQYINDCLVNKKIMNGIPYWMASNNLILKEILTLAKGKNLFIKLLGLVKWEEQFESFESQNRHIVLNYSMKANILDLHKNLEKIKENSNKLQEYALFMLVNMGYLTTDQINPQDYCIKCYIPNKQIAILIKKQFSDWLYQNKMFCMSLVDVLNYKQFCQKMIETYQQLKQFYNFENEYAFSAIFGARISMGHRNNEQKSFFTSTSTDQGTSYYPINNTIPDEKKYLVIHQYKYMQHQQINKQISDETIEEGIYQILLKNYLQFGVKLYDEYQGRVNKIILRGIFIVQDVQKRQIKLIKNEIKLTIQEAQLVSRYFDDKKNQYEGQGKKVSTTNKFKQILQQQEVSHYQELIQKIIKEGMLRKKPETQIEQMAPTKKRNV